MKVPAICFVLACLALRFELVTSDISGQFLSPSGCTTSCVYNLTWHLDIPTNNIFFSLIAQQAQGTWLGVAFGNTTFMETQNVIYGYMDSSNVGHVVDAWVGAPYSMPVTDTIQNIAASQIAYSGGFYTLTFSLPQVSPDNSQDFPFTTGLYFKYPVGGGPMSGSSIRKHFNTPQVSASTICICSGASVPPSPPPSGASPPPSGPSMPPSPPPSGPSMPPSPPPSGGSPPPSGPSMSPSPQLFSEPTMPPSPPPTGESMESSEQPYGESTSNPSTGGSGSSSSATKKTLIASLVVFGALAALVMLICVCYTISSTTTTTAEYNGF